MKIIDSNGRLFGKINILDILVVAVVIALLFSVKVKFDESPQQMSSDKIIEYTVSIKGVRQPTVDAINKKLEKVVDKETKKELGDIINVDVKLAEEMVKLTDATYTITENKDKYDMLLTINVSGTETKDNYFTLTGKKLITGDSIEIYNQYASVSGVIKSVKVVNK